MLGHLSLLFDWCNLRTGFQAVGDFLVREWICALPLDWLIFKLGLLEVQETHELWEVVVKLSSESLVDVIDLPSCSVPGFGLFNDLVENLLAGLLLVLGLRRILTNGHIQMLDLPGLRPLRSS